jgi:Predicted membrane protein
MTTISIDRIIEKSKKAAFYKMCFYFFSFGFIGWIFETISIIFTDGKLMNRGFLFVRETFPFVWGLPIIAMYGVGGLIISLVFKKYRHFPIKIFFLSIALMTLFELLVSYLCDFLFHQPYWVYRDAFNFDGRISLMSSIMWGFLSLVTVSFVEPRIDKIYQKVRESKFFKIITYILLVYLVICIGVRDNFFLKLIS